VKLMRLGSHELYGYKLLLENLSEATTEAALQRFQALMATVPEQDTLWFTPQVLPLLNGRLETSAIIQQSGRWYCVPPPATGADDAVAASAQESHESDVLGERLLDILTPALNGGFADRVYEFRCRDVTVLAHELRAAFQRYCGEVDDLFYLKLVGSKEFSCSPYESIRKMLSGIDPEWLQLYLRHAGRRILRESYGSLSERATFRFSSDPVQAKDYLVMLGLVVDAFQVHAKSSGLPFLVVLQEPEYMDRASRAVVQGLIDSGQLRDHAKVGPIPVILSGRSSPARFTWAAPVYSFFMPTPQPETSVPKIHMLLDSVLNGEEIARVAEGHATALQLIEDTPTEASNLYDDCSTEVRRLRSEYGNLLCERYVNLRTGIHPRVVAALEWAGRWREAFSLWNDLFNATIEQGCSNEAEGLLAGAPLGAPDEPAQSELSLAIDAGTIRLKALVAATETPESAIRLTGPVRRSPVAGTKIASIAQANGRHHALSGRVRSELNWILACADQAVTAGDPEALKQYAKDALMRAQELGDREMAGRAQLHLADSLLKVGRVTEAREYAGRVRSEAKTNMFGKHEHGLLIEGCAYFIDGNLTRVGQVLDALKEREAMVMTPSSFRVLRRVLGFRYALELGRHESARLMLGEMRQFLELIGKQDWALSLKYWDTLCVLIEGGSVAETVAPASRSNTLQFCKEMLRENQLIDTAALVSQGRAGEALELLCSLPSADSQPSTIYLLRPPRVFLVEDQALGPEIVFERMRATCRALALLQRGESAPAGELMGQMCRDAARGAVDPYRRLYLMVYSMALSRSRGADDPDPGAVLGQAVRLLRERTARIENTQEKLEFQRANPINRRLISLAREHNLW
ncbi:MAG: hypothetical protein LC641_04725, partial [Spirochaeta sp.]|nr:hypothetical protein [Spirochaeta sp.]